MLNRLRNQSFFVRAIYLMVLVFGIFVFAVFGAPETADACPTCKDSIEHHWLSLQQGYALSILLLMGMPFSIAIGWAVAIYRMVKKSNY